MKSNLEKSKFDIQVESPANIALMKYMGKSNSAMNLPANSSLSLTLSGLCTRLRVTSSLSAATDDQDQISHFSGTHLSDKATVRFQAHLNRMRTALPDILRKHSLLGEIPAQVQVESENTFPQGVGIASSASSFSALTLAFAAASSNDLAQFERQFMQTDLRIQLATLSQRGSGSSCRSFLGPWVSWSDSEVMKLSSDFPKLSDVVAVVDASEKEIPSSEAHERVLTSPLWEGRVGRAEDRNLKVRLALQEGNWDEVVRLTRDEMMEMHSLFHTAEDPFTYWTPGTLTLFKWLKGRSFGGIKPIVTMDAGPNVHLLVPESIQKPCADALRDAFPNFKIMEDAEGQGARLV